MSKQRAKGTAAETAVVNYLKANGFPDADRSPLRGVLDKGDVAGIRNVVIEIKNQRTYAIPAGFASWKLRQRTRKPTRRS